MTYPLRYRWIDTWTPLHPPVRLRPGRADERLARYISEGHTDAGTYAPWGVAPVNPPKRKRPTRYKSHKENRERYQRTREHQLQAARERYAERVGREVRQYRKVER